MRYYIPILLILALALASASLPRIDVWPKSPAPTNFSITNVNSSGFWDNLDTPNDFINIAVARNTTTGNLTVLQQIRTKDLNVTRGLEIETGGTLRIAGLKGSTKHLILADTTGTLGINVFITFDGHNVSVLGLIAGNITIDAGGGLYISETGNASMGIATLSSGKAVINTNKVTANSRIFISDQGGSIANIGSLYISGKSAGNQFNISSTNILDGSDVAWQILEPT